MPTSAEGEPQLVDTSVAVALLTADHRHHQQVFAAVAERRLGLAGHAAFETFSVLTRLPAPARRTPASAARLIEANFPHSVFLGAERAQVLVEDLAASGVAGGAVYDALVAAVCIEHGRRLVTRDQRALGTYRALGADVEVLR
ncbi:type II toxin-antitoxin system VapC family toxin [Desertihabitans aurantiacus]|uniref:type II toxin-antitoxin system VapC family toxin n=1 Tax=Desertihabitans aurantiacus TaxID=2282477 RepID=UPI000DF817F4|nr:type II toxin-antitoxin system VapC family toxin [Desertihabitans aurantiacus]